jgi:hypothetical protein
VLLIGLLTGIPGVVLSGALMGAAAHEMALPSTPLFTWLTRLLVANTSVCSLVGGVAVVDTLAGAVPPFNPGAAERLRRPFTRRFR